MKASLAQQTLFATSDGKTIERLANAARVVNFKSGAYVAFQGEVESPLLLILSGQLRVSRLPEKGDEAPITTVSAGGSIGAVPIISSRPSNINVIANRESTVAMIGRTLARQVLCEPLVSIALNGVLASLVGHLVHCHSRRDPARRCACSCGNR
ncbi:cyclic nucleotide-binding domain-containing protein [Paraburkholderia aromaticivorans]|uniref:cyclic nucleotide-binding domain-containing protein n=1 Tax=Paraburkholderia aromaticivorans TaxID=2026199 RepID=UPI0012FDF850|nr:cyclic nucleotide-binding domain-containing protein [Paraburkholderia aromaticivorans]